MIFLTVSILSIAHFLIYDLGGIFGVQNSWAAPYSVGFCIDHTWNEPLPSLRYEIELLSLPVTGLFVFFGSLAGSLGVISSILAVRTWTPASRPNSTARSKSLGVSLKLDAILYYKSEIKYIVIKFVSLIVLRIYEKHIILEREHNYFVTDFDVCQFSI